MTITHMLASVILSISMAAAPAAAGPPKAIADHGTAMLRDAEEMVMHGGMGDAGAILHHCGEVTKHAEAILHLLPKGDEHGQAAALHLQDAIKYCKRVADMGDKVDPGASLNPATKARASAREAMKHLSAMRDSGA
jgi:predicted ATPase